MLVAAILLSMALGKPKQGTLVKADAKISRPMPLFKKRAQQVKSGDARLVMMVLLKEPKNLSAETFREAFQKRFGVATVEGDHELLKINRNGNHVMAVYINTPIPNREAEEVAENSPYWGDGSAEHQAHFVLAGMGSDALKTAELVNQVAATFTDLLATVGWYVGSANQVIDPVIANDFATKSDIYSMTPVWVSILVTRDVLGKSCLSTFGMETFGKPELEIVDTTADPAEWRSRLYDFCDYILSSGKEIRDGDTFGETKAERFRVEVGKSKLGKPGTVARIVVP